MACLGALTLASGKDVERFFFGRGAVDARVVMRIHLGGELVMPVE